jgi:hypothetical protein
MEGKKGMEGTGNARKEKEAYTEKYWANIIISASQYPVTLLRYSF